MRVIDGDADDKLIAVLRTSFAALTLADLEANGVTTILKTWFESYREWVGVSYAPPERVLEPAGLGLALGGGGNSARGPARRRPVASRSPSAAAGPRTDPGSHSACRVYNARARTA
ncbi:MAG TPA: hypothetical protein VF912_04975 [Anaeromyxobacter sp.]